MVFVLYLFQYICYGGYHGGYGGGAGDERYGLGCGHL